MTENNNVKSSLADILLVLSKHLALIILLTTIGVIFTYFYVNSNWEPEYISTTQLFVPPEEGSQGSDISKIANQFGLVTSRGASSNMDITSAFLYPDIKNSRTFNNIMLDKEFYTEKFDKKLPLIAIFTYGEDSIPSNIDTLRIAAQKRLPDMVKFTAQMGFFYIDVTTEEPRFSKDLADTLLVELDKIQRHFREQKVKEKISFIDKKIALAKSELENIEQKLMKFREQNRNVENSPSLLLIQERLQRDVQIQSGIFLTLKQQLELAKIEEVQKSSFVQILDPPSLPIKESNPIKKSVYIFGGFVGFFIAIGLALIFEYFTNRNKNEAIKLKQAKDNIYNSIKNFITLKWLRKKRQ